MPGLTPEGSQVRPPSSVRQTTEYIEWVTQPWVASVKEMASRAGSVKVCLSQVAPPSTVRWSAGFPPADQPLPSPRRTRPNAKTGSAGAQSRTGRVVVVGAEEVVVFGTFTMVDDEVDEDDDGLEDVTVVDEGSKAEIGSLTTPGCRSSAACTSRSAFPESDPRVTANTVPPATTTATPSAKSR